MIETNPHSSLATIYLINSRIIISLINSATYHNCKLLKETAHKPIEKLDDEGDTIPISISIDYKNKFKSNSFEKSIKKELKIEMKV